MYASINSASLQTFWPYLTLVIAALALFYLAYHLSALNLQVLLAIGIVFCCLVALSLMARRHPATVTQKPAEKTTLLSPTVLVSEVRAAALVTYGQIGTVSVRKERAKAAWHALDRFFGEELEMDVGVRVVAGVNLRYLVA